MKRGPLALTALALVALAWAFDLRRVGDEEMAPSLLPGDWVIIGPGRPGVGDVVRLRDPLEPDRMILRRVLGTDSGKIRYEGGVLRVNGDGARLREMGRADGFVVLSESNGWLIRQLDRTLRGPPINTELGSEQLWLMADDRDEAVDSRWWGPLSEEALDGVVWLRLGSADAWRRRWTWRGVDGPWLPPSKREGSAG